MTTGRAYITVVEIDVPFCTRTYGNAPCTASLSADTPRKCFNTRGTCQDIPNLDLSPLTLRFSTSQTGIPKGQTIFPALKSVSTRPGEINLSGIDKRMSALGKRATVTLEFGDFAYHDTLTDKYQSERVSGAAQNSGVGYNPEDQGTFFGRLRARWPHWRGAAVRVKRGTTDQALAAMTTEHYVLDEWSGPDGNGRVTMKAKDILALTEKDNALVPAPSNGILAADISETDRELTLSPSGIGDSEYAASGRVCVGKEVMSFTRSGDTLTLTGRGMDGTDAAAHDADNTVQECFHLDGVYIGDAIQAVIAETDVPSSFIDTSEWGDENHWVAGFALTVTVTSPTGAAKLISEICQLGVMVWWEPTEQKIKYRPNRPLEVGETFFQITDVSNAIEGTLSSAVSEDQRIGTAVIYHGVIDVTKVEDTTGNYRKATASTSGEVGYNDTALREIRTRWFGPNGNGAVVSVLAERLANRYSKAPRIFKCELDAKDSGSVDLGALVQITSRVLADDAGFSVPMSAQVRFMERRSDRIIIHAETYDIDGRFGYWMDGSGGLPDYSTATDIDKANGAFWMDESTGTFSDGTGPYLWF